jgi:quinol monooxygenase YgiN/quercetin dioxygenase-like cupin family protein
MPRTLLIQTLLAASLLGVIDTPARAASLDPVSLYPGNYAVLLENDRVRVLDFKLARGARESMHEHPANVVYVLAPFRIRFTSPDGNSVVREAKAGEVLYNPKPFQHASENIGDTDAHGLLVELKTGGGTAAGTAAGAGAAVGDANPTNLLTAVTFIEGTPEEAGELRDALLSITAPTRSEPANLAYDLYVSPDHPSRFMRFEVWKSDQGLEDHKQYPHFKESFAKRQEKGWKTQITRWKRVGP